jgi:hypothetical protein
MKRTLISLCGFTGLIAATASACRGAAPPPGDGTASVSMAVTSSQPNFTGNSILITGTRAPFADLKYRCDNSVSGCFNFTMSGDLTGVTSPYVGAPGFTELCPSNDLDDMGHPGGTWSFTYEVYVGGNCMGTVLAGGPNPPDATTNFSCFDHTDIVTQHDPDETVGESLVPGSNTNTIICLTHDASKSFDFNSCAEISGPTTSGVTTSVTLDCACTLGPNLMPPCVCPQFDTSAPPSGCAADPMNNCYVTCTSSCGGPMSMCTTNADCCSGVCGATTHTCSGACPNGDVLCGTVCTNTSTDPANCGMCGHVCPMTSSCSGGACTCPAGEIGCGAGATATCSNPQTDPNNCGMCGHICPAGQTCVMGTCA